MSRYGDEMIGELANLLNKYGTGLDKTAAKKEEKCEKCDKEPCKCKEMKEKEEAKEEKAKEKEEAKEEKAKEKEEAKEEKAKAKAKAKKKKKAEFMSSVLTNLVKLAEELDAAGADEAASLVDDALRVIVKNIKEEK